MAGGLGGICLVLVGHPFDLIKVRLQTSNEYRSTWHAFTRIIRHDGLLGLYRGVTAPLLSISPIFAVCFWGYAVGLQLVDAIAPKTDESIRCMTAGGFSALPTTVILAPAERIKVMMQVTGGLSFGGALQRAWGEGGIASLYKGSMATLARDVPGSIAYFGVYEWAKRVLVNPNADHAAGNAAAILTAGGLAGMANWTVAIPADVIKSRWQSAPLGTYRSATDVFRRLLREEGPSALFKGIVPVMMRAFPANAACFYGMETGRQIFDDLLPS